MLDRLSLAQLYEVTVSANVAEDYAILVDLVGCGDSQISRDLREVNVPTLEGIALAGGIGLGGGRAMLDRLSLAQLYEVTVSIIVAEGHLVLLLGHLDHEEIGVVIRAEVYLATAFAADGGINLGIRLVRFTVMVLGNDGVIAVLVVIHVDAVIVVQAVQLQRVAVSLEGDAVLVDLGDVVALKERLEIITELRSQLILGHHGTGGVEGQLCVGILGQRLVQRLDQQLLVKVDLQIVAVAEFVAVGQLVAVSQIVQDRIEGDLDLGRAILAANGDVNSLVLLVAIDLDTVLGLGVIRGVSGGLGHGLGQLNGHAVLIQPADQGVGLTGGQNLVVNALGQDERIAVRKGHGGGDLIAVLIDVGKGHVVGLQLVGDLDLAVGGNRELQRGIAVLVSTYGTLDDGVTHLDHVLAAVLDIVHVHADGVATLGRGDINGFAVLVREDHLVGHVAVLVLGAGHVEVHVVGILALLGDLVKNVLDLLLGQLDLNVVSVVELNADVGGLALLEDGAHGDVDLVVARSVAVHDDLVTVTVLIHGHVAALGILVTRCDVVDRYVGHVCLSRSGDLDLLGTVLQSPACKGVDVSGVLLVGHGGDLHGHTEVKGLGRDDLAVPILKDDGVSIDGVISGDGDIIGHAAVIAKPACEGVAYAGGVSGCDGGRTCGNGMLLQHGQAVVINEGHGKELGLIHHHELGVVVSHEGDLAVLCTGKDVLAVAPDLEVAVGAVINVSHQVVVGQALHGQDILLAVVGHGLEGDGVLVNGVDLIALNGGMVSRLDHLAGGGENDLVEGILKLGMLGDGGLQGCLQGLMLVRLVREEDVQLVAANHQGVLQAEAVLQFTQQRREEELAAVGIVVDNDLNGILGMLQIQTLVGIVGKHVVVLCGMASGADHGSGDVTRPGSQEGADLLQRHVDTGDIGGCFNGVAVLHECLVGHELAVLVVIIEGNGVGLALLDHADLGVVGGGEGQHGIALIISADDRCADRLVFARHGVLDVDLVFTALGSLGHVDGHGIAAVALQVRILAVHTEGEVVGVDGIALLVGGHDTGYVQIHVLVGLTVSQAILQLLADGGHLVGRKEDLQEVAVSKVDTDEDVQLGILLGGLQHGAHGDHDAAIFRSVSLDLEGRIGIVGGRIGRRDDHVAALGITVLLVVLCLKGHITDHGQIRGLPALEGVDGGEGLDHGQMLGGNRGVTVRIGFSLGGDPVAVRVTVGKGNGIEIQLIVVLGNHGQIRGDGGHVGIVLALAAVPEAEGVGVLHVLPGRGDHGSRGCRAEMLDAVHGDGLQYAVLIVILKGNGIFSQLEGNLNGGTAGGLNEGIFAVGHLGHVHRVAVLVGDNDLVHHVALVGGHGDGHGLACGGVFGFNGHGAVLGGSNDHGIFLGLLHHVDLTVYGGGKLNDGLAVLVGADDLVGDLHEVTLGVLHVNHVFLLGIGQGINVDTDGVAARAFNDHVLTVHAEGDVVLHGRLAVDLGLLTGGVDRNVVVGKALLLQDLIQLSDDVLHLLGGEVDLHEVAVAEVMGVLETLGGILLQLLDHGAQGHVDLGDALAVGADHVDGDIVVLLVLADDHAIVDIVVVAGGRGKLSGIGCVLVGLGQCGAPGLEGVGVVQVRILGGCVDRRDIAPGHGGLGVLLAVNNPGNGVVYALGVHLYSQCAVGHRGICGQGDDLVACGDHIRDGGLEVGLVKDGAEGHGKLLGGGLGVARYGVGQRHVNGELMLSDAVFIRQGCVDADVSIGRYGHGLAVVEINGIVSFLLGHVAKEDGEIHTGSHKHALDGFTVVDVVEAVIAQVDVKLKTDIVEIQLIKDLLNHGLSCQLTASHVEGEAAEDLLEQVLEVCLISGAVEGKEVVAIVQLAQGRRIPLLGDLVHHHVQDLSELLTLVDVQLSARQQLDHVIVVAVADEVLQLTHGHIGVDGVEVVTVHRLKAGQHTLDGIGGSGRLVGGLEDELHLLVGQIDADGLTALDVDDGHSLLQPLAHLHQVGGITLKGQRNRPGIGGQAVGGELELVITEGLVGDAAHLHGGHVGEAVHGIVLASDEALDAVGGNKTAHVACDDLIQNGDQVIQAVVLHGEDIVAVDGQGIDARVDTSGGHVIHQRLDLGLQLASVIHVQKVAENVHVVVLCHAQGQDDLLAVLVDDGLEDTIGRRDTVGDLDQLLCQVGHGTLNDDDLSGIGGSLKESAAIPTDVLTRNEAQLGLFGIREHVHVAVGLGHDNAVGVPFHRIGGRLLTGQVALLCLDEGDQLIHRRHLLQHVQHGIDGHGVITVGVKLYEPDERAVVLLQQSAQLRQLLLREVHGILLMFIVQIVLREVDQRLAIKRGILTVLKETLNVPQRIRRQLKGRGRQDGANSNEGKHENCQNDRQKSSHAHALFAHNTPPVYHIFYPFVHESTVRDNNTYNIIP